MKRRPAGESQFNKVERNTPARAAGFKKGDVVLEIDGLRIENPYQFAQELTVLPPGSEVTFLIRRDEEELFIKFTSDKYVEKRENRNPNLRRNSSVP